MEIPPHAINYKGELGEYKIWSAIGEPVIYSSVNDWCYVGDDVLHVPPSLKTDIAACLDIYKKKFEAD